MPDVIPRQFSSNYVPRPGCGGHCPKAARAVGALAWKMGSILMRWHLPHWKEHWSSLTLFQLSKYRQQGIQVSNSASEEIQTWPPSHTHPTVDSRPRPPPSPTPTFSPRNWPPPPVPAPLLRAPNGWSRGGGGRGLRQAHLKKGRGRKEAREEKKEKPGGEAPSNDKAQGWAPAAILIRAAQAPRRPPPSEGEGRRPGEKSSERRAAREAPLSRRRRAGRGQRRPRAASDAAQREEAAAPAPGRPGRRLWGGRRGRPGRARGEGGVLAVPTVAGRQHQGAGRRLQAVHAPQHGVHELGRGALELPLQPQAPVLPAHPAQQGRLRLLVLPGPGARAPAARRRPPPARPARRGQEEAPRSPGARRGQEAGPAAPAGPAGARGAAPGQARDARALLRGPHPGGDLEGGHPDADHLPHHPRRRRRVGRAQPGGGAAQGAPSAARGPGARGEAPPLPGAPGVRRGRARPLPAAGLGGASAAEGTSVSRVFTEPAGTASPSALYARRSSRRLARAPGRGRLRDRCALRAPRTPRTRTRLDPRGAPLASDPRLDASPGLRGQIRFSLWTLPHWSGSPPKKSFFSKGIFSVLV
ncbi:PREDICTED: translation initiation factor IF-2-like [Chinchilla lanigera]|uniref:translation initiation factor IF-2-like n=1 Tax=Chinchilla lanigera TaxID=34839 RepID=UPI000698C84B|nr:PREDICTED: translation initiation factor IF-2-like [Chinchilla lanigera]